MTTAEPTGTGGDPLAEEEEGHVDPNRVRSFAGLVLGRLGPRAYGLVSGVLLVLLVSARTNSLLAVTFALTAHRLLSFAVFPLLGRLSDQSRSRLGRRAPFMAGGLLVMAACTALYPSARSYWALVILIVIARQARVAYALPSAAATPEIFGRSRWVRAIVGVTVTGVGMSLLVRGTVVATWERNNPATWAPAFRMAAGFLALSAVAVALLVREAPAAKEVAEKRVKAWRTEVGEMVSTRNARCIAAALLLALAASGATDRAFPVYAEKVLGASGGTQAGVGFIAGPAFLLVGLPLGLLLAHLLPRRVLAIVGPLAGVIAAVAHLWITHLWQSVVIGAVGAPFLVAMIVAYGPFLASLLPRTGGIAERFGLLAGPIGVVGVVSAYISGLTYDYVVHDYRVIWVIAAVFTGACAIPLARVQVPAGLERTELRRTYEELKGALSRQRQEAHTGPHPHLFTGAVTAKDADATVVIDQLRDLAERWGFAGDGATVWLEDGQPVTGEAGPDGTVTPRARIPAQTADHDARRPPAGPDPE